jgi:ubiquinone/menaquinone biosynthesis C-methylase UbiE
MPFSLQDSYKRLFAWLMARGGEGYEHAMATRKQALFADLQGELLEIGPGAGSNLRYVPQQAHWRGVEPNPYMHPYLKAEAERLGLKVEVLTGSAEHLDLPDNCLDGVVSTLVLCSVPNLSATLAEIYRVLKPGGTFYFVEHVAAPAGTLLRQVQDGIRPLWQIIGDGCQSNRETGEAIAAAGFDQVSYEDFKAPIPIPIVQPHIMGIAVK